MSNHWVVHPETNVMLHINCNLKIKKIFKVKKKGILPNLRKDTSKKCFLIHIGG